jgi:hypothetical protein
MGVFEGAVTPTVNWGTNTGERLWGKVNVCLGGIKLVASSKLAFLIRKRSLGRKSVLDQVQRAVVMF